MDYERLGFATPQAYEFPGIVNVEVYRGRCPCRCVHCPVGIVSPAAREATFGHAGMELALWEKILGEMSGHSPTLLRVHSTGEPLLWDDLRPALEMLSPAPVRSWIFTSGITTDRSILETVCRNTNIVEVSVNSITPGDYLATKGVDAFAQVVGNLEYMHECVVARGLGTRLLASRVESSDARADEEFVRHWKSSGLVHDAFVRSYHAYNGLLGESCWGEPSGKRSPCLVHWARFNVGVRGQAVVCFNELFRPSLSPSVVLGDLHDQTIASIWQGAKLKEIRRAELRGDYAQLSWGDALPCRTCRFCQALRGQRPTSEYQINQWSCQHAPRVPGTPRV